MSAAESNLDQSELNYLKEKTNLSLQKILDYYRQFVSKYNNGCVNRQQFVEIIKKLFIDKNNDDQNANEKLAMCERLFDICDQDDDGTIDFKEYLVLFWSKVNGSPREKLSLIFDMYDLNSSGYIDFHELHSIVRVLVKLKFSASGLVDDALHFPIIGVPTNSTLPSTYHVAMEIMRRFDCNRNAKLSKDEFVNGCLSHENIKTFLTPLKVL